MYFGKHWQRLGGYWDVGDGNGMDILGLFDQGVFPLYLYNVQQIRLQSATPNSLDILEYKPDVLAIFVVISENNSLAV
jgi:hypothetical protein